MNKLKFDKEYQTMYFKEVDFLKEHGILPTFDKMENGVKIFKYKKTPELFNQLGIFYTQK